jgi:hypothetical protein
VGFELGPAFLGMRAARRVAVDETTEGEATYNINDKVPSGKLAVPRKIRFVAGGGAMPSLTMGIEVRNGVATCTYLELVAGSDNDVRAKHLKLIPIETWVKRIVAECAEDVVETTKKERIFIMGRATAEKLDAVERMQRRRRDPRQDRTLLERVAALYRQHPDAPNKAVAAEFGVSERTAGRWAEYCSDAGLLPKAPKQGQKRL